MKCPNCGFESNEKFCKMCGTKIPDIQSQENNNPYINSNNFQQTGSVPPINSVSLAENAFGQQIPNGMPSPVQNPNGMPAAPQNRYPQPPAVPQKNSKGKSASVIGVVVACFVALVLIAGIIINIVSASTYNSSIIDSLQNMSTYEDMYYYSYDNIDYGKLMSVGETAVMPNSKLEVISFELNDINEDDENLQSYYNNCKELTIECEFTNTANQEKGNDIYLSEYDFILFPHVNPDFYCEIIYPNNNYSYLDYYIEPGKTKTFTIHYAVPKNCESFTLQYYTYYYDTENNEYINSCQFEIR